MKLAKLKKAAQKKPAQKKPKGEPSTFFNFLRRLRTKYKNLPQLRLAVEAAKMWQTMNRSDRKKYCGTHSGRKPRLTASRPRTRKAKGRPLKKAPKSRSPMKRRRPSKVTQRSRKSSSRVSQRGKKRRRSHSDSISSTSLHEDNDRKDNKRRSRSKTKNSKRSASNNSDTQDLVDEINMPKSKRNRGKSERHSRTKEKASRRCKKLAPAKWGNHRNSYHRSCKSPESRSSSGSNFTSDRSTLSE